MDQSPPAGTTPETTSDSAFSDQGLAEPAAWTVPPNVKTLRAVDAPVQLDKSLVAAKTASPRLSDELFARLLAYGTPQETRPGDVLFKPGDMDVDLIVIGCGIATSYHLPGQGEPLDERADGLVHGGDGAGALAGGGGHPLHRAGADVADREHARNAGLERKRLAPQVGPD
jgi:hypothetical protein